MNVCCWRGLSKTGEQLAPGIEEIELRHAGDHPMEHLYYNLVRDLDAVEAELGPYQEIIQDNLLTTPRLGAKWIDGQGQVLWALLRADQLINKGHKFQCVFSDNVTFPGRWYGKFTFEGLGESWDWLADAEHDPWSRSPIQLMDICNHLPEEVMNRLLEILRPQRRRKMNSVVRNEQESLKTAHRIFDRIANELAGRCRPHFQDTSPQAYLKEIGETLASVKMNQGQPFYCSSRVEASEPSPLLYTPEWYQDTSLTDWERRCQRKNALLHRQLRRKARRLTARIGS